MDEARIDTLAEASRQGDERSFRALVDALTRSLIAVAFRYTRDWEEARDLAQETWMRAWAGLHLYEPGRPFRSWLYAIHRNGCLDHLRRGWTVRASLPGDEALGRLPSPAREPDAERRIETQELRTLLLRAAETLPARQRLAFFRVDVEGGEPRDVAGEMGIEHGTLRATLHAARRRVAESLREEPEERAS